MKLKCTNISESVSNWGRGESAKEFLKVGNIYTLNDEEVHSWHTIVELKELPGHWFNDAHFEYIGED